MTPEIACLAITTIMAIFFATLTNWSKKENKKIATDPIYTFETRYSSPVIELSYEYISDYDPDKHSDKKRHDAHQISRAKSELFSEIDKSQLFKINRSLDQETGKEKIVVFIRVVKPNLNEL